MTVQTFIPKSAQAASENTVTQPQHTHVQDSVKKLYIETQGCQMNEYDSHRMADLLGDSHGYVLTTDPKEADILLMNTCSIREKAQEKVFSELGRWRKLKEKNPDLIIGVGGCVASQEGDNIQKRANYVDMIFGPQTLHRLPQMLDRHVILQGPTPRRCQQHMAGDTRPIQQHFHRGASSPQVHLMHPILIRH